MRIARSNKVDVREIPENLRISESEWTTFADQADYLLARNRWYKDEPFSPNYIITNNGNLIRSEIRYRVGVLFIRFETLSDEVLYYSSLIAKDLKANIYGDNQKPISREKIDNAKERFERKYVDHLYEYQSNSFGGNNTWLAIKSNLHSITDYFNLNIQFTNWKEGLDIMNTDNHVVLVEFDNWTFIAGESIYKLFDCYTENPQETDEFLKLKCLEIGQDFNEFQFFSHYNRSIYINAFYKIKNGKFIYGEFQTEGYSKLHGQKPNEIESLFSTEVSNVASAWGYSPNDLRYKKVEKVYISKIS